VRAPSCSPGRMCSQLFAPAANMRCASLVVSWRLRPPRRRARRFMAFDRHMNLVLGDAEEYRTLPPKKGRSEEDVRRPPGPRLPAPALRPRKQRPGPAPQFALLPLFACADCARQQETHQRTALRRLAGRAY